MLGLLDLFDHLGRAEQLRQRPRVVVTQLHTRTGVVVVLVVDENLAVSVVVDEDTDLSTRIRLELVADTDPGQFHF